MIEMTKITVKYWEEGKAILIGAGDWDCFLRNESLNPMINWLNLYRQEIVSGTGCCNGSDRMNNVEYSSVNGNLMIKTDRDVVFLSKEQRGELIHWLRDHKDILSIREVNL
jgi:hypothetical protein